IAAGVPEHDERVAAQVARIVPWHEEPVVARGQLLVRGLEPIDERDVRLRPLRRRLAGAPLLDSPVPRADVLADVAAVDLIPEFLAVRLGNRRARLRPVRK